MAHYRSDRAVTERKDEPKRVCHQVRHPVRREIAVILRIPTCCPPVPALIGCNNVKPSLDQRQHHLSPAICELRKAVQQQDAGAAFITGLKDVHP